MIHIIIPVFNRVDYTIACIDSILAQTYQSFNIIIVDDGSTDDTFRILSERYPNITVLRGDGNLWWSASMNMGINYALKNAVPSDKNYVLSLNNDLTVGKDYLDQLVKSTGVYKKAIIGSVSVDIENKTVEYVGFRWNSYWASRFPATLKEMGIEKIQQLKGHINSSYLPGRGILIPFDCFEKIGLFDHIVFPHYAGDHDFSLRAKAAGYLLLINTRAVVYSYVNATALSSLGKLSKIEFIKQSFTSIKSPLNLKTRYRWAKRHASSPYLIYFAIDFLRVSKSLALKIARKAY